MQVIVHGGAGGVPDDPDPRQAVLDEAAESGAAAAKPLDAVESAVRVLETSPRFNAGVGSCAQSDGILRTDAGVMTDDRSVGAAASMPGVEAAVSVARAVLEETPHILLSGVHAVDFAAAQGVDCEVDLWTDSTRERFADADVPDGDMAAQARWVMETFGGSTADPDAEQTPAAEAERAPREQPQPRPQPQPELQQPEPEAETRAARPARAAPQRAPEPEVREVEVTEYWIQVIATTSRDRVEMARRRLSEHELSGRITTTVVDGRTFYRLRVGPYTNKGEASKFLDWVNDIDGFEESYISEEYNTRTVRG